MAEGVRIESDLVERLHARARADRWQLAPEAFARALEASAGRAFAGATPTPHEVTRYLVSLHLEDLALACACVAGREEAWDEFVHVYRPHLYRAADAIDQTGRARDLADSLFADLFGIQERGGAHHSLFEYFHGRSSLATWLRAVVAQRHVDELRRERRLVPLPEEGSAKALTAPGEAPDLERPQYVGVIQRVFARAVAALAPRDRLRLGCYYAQSLTLAAIGRLTGEHEATVSRHLARTRRALRRDVERRLTHAEGLSRAQIAQCFASVVGDAGSLDLRALLGPPAATRKPRQTGRSTK